MNWHVDVKLFGQNAVLFDPATQEAICVALLDRLVFAAVLLLFVGREASRGGSDRLLFAIGLAKEERPEQPAVARLRAQCARPPPKGTDYWLRTPCRPTCSQNASRFAQPEALDLLTRLKAMQHNTLQQRVYVTYNAVCSYIRVHTLRITIITVGK